MATAKSIDYGDESTISLRGTQEKLLKSAVICGANGSGKTSLIQAMSGFRDAILHSFSDNRLIKTLAKIHLEKDIREVFPRHFEAIVLIDPFQYRYGFEILYSGDVVSEWLYRKSPETGRESFCFKRQEQQIVVNSRVFKGTGGVAKKTKSTSLFLSACEHFRVEEILPLVGWFKSRLIIINSFRPREVLNLYESDDRLRLSVLKFMNFVNLQIDDSDRLKGKGKRWSMKTRDGLPLSKSKGIQEIFSLAVYLFHAMESRGVLVIDNFAENLHPNMAYLLVKLFQSRVNRYSQFIFSTHITSLLRKDLFRTDQIWFTEKDENGDTKLYSLVEFIIDKWRIIEKDFSFEKDYLQGRYGAIPTGFCVTPCDEAEADFKRLLKWYLE